jgi:hypothetical protein
MARPKPNILHSVELDDGSTWDILEADAFYVITYQGQVCGIRQHNLMLANTGFRYKKLSYPNHGNALAQARRLNAKFNCTDFDVKKVS